MLKSYRITKYNPDKRNKDWHYLDFKEWTSISDFENENIAQYYKMEDKYIQIIIKIMEIYNITSLIIKNYEKRDKYNDITFKEWISQEIFENISNNKTILLNDIPTIVRSILRENIWCKLQWERNFFIHFWWDFYMYIGFRDSKKIVEKLKNINTTDLFIEEFRSPYLR